MHCCNPILTSLLVYREHGNVGTSAPSSQLSRLVNQPINVRRILAIL